MNKFILLCFISVLSVTITSCGEHLDMEELESISPDPSNFLTFNSLEDFKDFNNRISTMTDKEFDDWEKTNNYISYHTILKHAYKELDSIKTDEENKMFSEKYSDILTLKDERWIPLIEIPFYQKIVNREGIYETNGYLNKVVGDYIFTAKKSNLQKLANINFTDGKKDQKAHRENGVRQYKYTSSESETTSNLRISSSCSTNMSVSYYKNPSKCKNDRKVFLTAKSYVSFAAHTNGDFFQPRVFINLWGEKRRSFWCDWVVYDTSLTRRNVSFSVKAFTTQPNGMAVPVDYNIALPDLTSPWDFPGLNEDILLGSGVYNQHITAFPFTRLHAEGTSRGVGDVWVVIDCN